MKLGWKVVLTLAGVGLAWTTAPLMAQNYQANQNVNQQYQPRYAAAPVANQQLPQWKHSVAPQNALPAQNVQQVNHQSPAFSAPQIPATQQNPQVAPVLPQQQFAQQYQQYRQPALPQYPVQQVPQQYQPAGYPTQNGYAQQQQPVAVTPQQTVVQPQMSNTPWNNFAQPVAQNPNVPRYGQGYALPAQQIAPQQQVTQVPQQQAVSPVASYNQPVVEQKTAAATETSKSIQPVSALNFGFGGDSCCEKDSCCDIEPLCENLDDCCSTECCEPVGCCEPCCGPTFYAGAAAVWLKPHFQDNTAMVLDPPPNDNLIIPFDYDFEASPRVWLGYEHCDGHGFRFSYWQFDEDLASTQLEVQPTQLAVAQVYGANGILTRNAFAGPGEWLTAEHSMELQTADFEFTSHHEYCKHDVLIGAGIRYAKMDQEYEAIAYTGGLGVTVDELVRNRHGFEGFGPTLSINWSRPFGDHGLAFYTNGRGSILFGDVYQDVYEIKNAGADIGNDNYDGDDSLAIGELGLGLQYSILGGYGCEWLVRAGYEGQLWLDAGGPMRTQGDMALHGISIGVGVSH